MAGSDAVKRAKVLARILAASRRAYIPERAVLTFVVTGDGAAAHVERLRASAFWRDLAFAAKGVEVFASGRRSRGGVAVEVLLKVFRDDREGLWRKAGVVRRLWRALQALGFVVAWRRAYRAGGPRVGRERRYRR